MLYLYIFLGLCVLGLIYMYFEASWLKVNHVRFTKSEQCLKVMHLTDIHINLLRVSVDKVKETIEKEQPDFIIMSGDYIAKVKHIPKFLKFLKEIKGNNQIFLCFGNHDYEAFLKNKEGKLQEYIKNVESLGVTVLHNQSVCYEKYSKKYNVIGITDHVEGSCDVKLALRDCCQDAFMNIAFSHNPDVVLDIPKGVDYLFCGHFHGGQIWMPFDLEFKLLRHEKLCKMGIKRGLHTVNNINLYINSGLGNVLFPLRFFSRPEIAVVYLP